MSEFHRDHFSQGTPVVAATGFMPGTLIETAQGPRQIETLKLGDLIETLDDGHQPLRSITRQKMRGTAGCAPVRIAAGVLGNDAPLLLGPHHRVLICGWQAELYFGQQEVLIEAVSLVNDTTVTREDHAQIEYIGLCFETHQIVLAQNAQVESDLPHAALSFAQAMSPRNLEAAPVMLARPLVAGAEARVLSL